MEQAKILAIFCWERGLKVQGCYKVVFGYCVVRKMCSIVRGCIGADFLFLVKVPRDVFAITQL